MRLLFAEDSVSLSRAVSTILQKNHYTVEQVYDGEAALEELQLGMYDGVILDVMMPKLDGIAVLQRARQLGITAPILMLTAKADVSDKVQGLDAGANDYLTKPFDMQELLARIRAMTRPQDAKAANKLAVGNVQLDRTTFELSTAKNAFRLAHKEYQMMEMMMNAPKQVFPTERLFEHIWGMDSDTEMNVVWVYISYLRKKLSALDANVQIVATRNIGYSLEVKADD